MPPRVANPEPQLGAEPSDGCLPAHDGALFNDVLTAARLTANSISNVRPGLTASDLQTARGSQHAPNLLLHLSALMYSYWDQAPAGPSVFQAAQQHMQPALRDIFRHECVLWGSKRLNAPVGHVMYIVQDTPKGTIVADHTMSNFYRVLGITKSPAALLRQCKLKLPAATRITALPFRGVLVCDGLLSGHASPVISNKKKKVLKRRYALAKEAGSIVTGFDTQQLSNCAPQRSAHVSDATTRSRTLERDAESSLSCAQTERAVSGHITQQLKRLAAFEHREGLTGFHRFGYTEATNPGHVVTIISESSIRAVFRTAHVRPMATEIVDQMVLLAERQGFVFSFVVVDDRQLVGELNSITEQVGVLAAFYPPPSVEESTFSTMCGGRLPHVS